MENLKLTLVQSNLEWQAASANRKILGELISNSVTDTDLIVLPEMFTSAFTMDSGAIAEDWPGNPWTGCMPPQRNSRLPFAAVSR